MELRLCVPAPSNLLLVNLLGALGLIMLAIAVGGLTGNWWWAALVGSVEAVVVSVIGMTHATEQARPAAEPRPIAAARSAS